MKFRTIILAGMAAATAAASAPAFAQDRGCVRENNNNQATGAVLGAIGGALIGNAVAGRHDKGTGTVVGAVGGAVAGSAIAGSQNQPCPAGYRYDGPPPRDYGPPPPGPGYGPPPPGDRRDFWYGAGGDIRSRIEFMQDRINRTYANRWISRREMRDANGELNRIRNEDRRLHYQDGPDLRPQDRDYLQRSLDALSQRLHWFEHN